jgi:hypothetical protein
MVAGRFVPTIARAASLVVGLMAVGVIASWPASFVAAQTHDEKPIELSGFSMSEAFEVQDNQPLDLSEKRILKLLYRIKKTSAKNLLQFSQFTQGTSWQDIVKKTPEFRFRVFSLQGTVQRVTRKRIPGATADDRIRSCFVSHCRSESGQAFQVVTLTSPSGWPLDVLLNEPIRFEGFLFGLVDAADAFADDLEDAADPSPLFVAKRMAWFPETANSDVGVSDSLVDLAKVGVDVGQFDFVRKQNTQALGTVDSDCFYQVLAGVGELPANEHPSESGFLGFISLLGSTANSNVDYFGSRVTFEARVRRCTPVQVSDPELKRKLGLSTYYQLMVFPDLEGQQISVDPTQKNLLYRQFPVTVCTRTLPAGFSSDQLVGEVLSFESVYFRFWKYKSKLTDDADVNGQLSPLFIVDQPQIVSLQRDFLSFVLGSFLMVTLCGLLAMVWFFRRTKTDKPLPERIDLSAFDLGPGESAVD